MKADDILETAHFHFFENLGFGVKGRQVFNPEENKHVENKDGHCYWQCQHPIMVRTVTPNDSVTTFYSLAILLANVLLHGW